MPVWILRGHLRRRRRVARSRLHTLLVHQKYNLVDAMRERYSDRFQLLHNRHHSLLHIGDRQAIHDPILRIFRPDRSDLHRQANLLILRSSGFARDRIIGGRKVKLLAQKVKNILGDSDIVGLQPNKIQSSSCQSILSPFLLCLLSPTC